MTWRAAALLLAAALSALTACADPGDPASTATPSDPRSTGGADTEPDAERRPNVVLVVLDTLRTDHLSAYGYGWQTSPHLDALAARGVIFTDCTAQASWTMPSMISLMTGEPIFRTVYKVPGSQPLLAERFAEAGWRTGGFAANSLLSTDAGFGRGFDDWDVRERGERRWTGADLVRQGLRFAEADDGRPFFLWLHFMDTHTPYESERRPWTRGPDELFSDWERQGFAAALEAAPDGQRAALAARFEAETRALADEVDRYDAGVARVDAYLGRLFAELRARDLLDDTYVAVVSDHGETLYRRPQQPHALAERRERADAAGQPLTLDDLLKKEHDGTVFEELVRTPWILAGPGLPAGRRVESLAANLDVGATLLGLCGLPSRHGSGRDLSHALRSGAPVPPAAWSTSSCDLALSAKLPGGRKLVVTRTPGPTGGLGEARLYDLAADPFERHPLPLDDDARVWLARLTEAAAAGPFHAVGGADADAETLERLRELGYVR